MPKFETDFRAEEQDAFAEAYANDWKPRPPSGTFRRTLKPLASTRPSQFPTVIPGAVTEEDDFPVGW